MKEGLHPNYAPTQVKCACGAIIETASTRFDITVLASIPDFETFAARNKARGFKETDEQLRAWYNSIFEQGRDLVIDNRYLSNIEGSPLKGYVFDEVTGEFIPDSKTAAQLQENLLQMISQAATEAQLDAANYFGSPNYLKIITRGGGDEKLARAISDAKQLEILNAEVEAAHLGRTSERLQGTNERIAGHPNKTTLNIDELATPNQVIETVYHELGGHGASANIEHKPAKWMNDLAVKNNEALKQENPILAAVAEHNSKHRPTETDLSELGKALRDGDIAKLQTMKEWEGEISTPEQAKAFYEYLVSDDGMQEISARVNANRIAKFSGKKNTWNKDQLKIFTPEYRRKIARWLWSLLPFSVAAASAKDSEQTQEHKQGGTIKIKKKNKGKFTASAKAAGKGVQEYAHKVMTDPNATPLQKKRANFAIQAKKWHHKHQLGGKINYLNYFK